MYLTLYRKVFDMTNVSDFEPKVGAEDIPVSENPSLRHATTGVASQADELYKKRGERDRLQEHLFALQRQQSTLILWVLLILFYLCVVFFAFFIFYPEAFVGKLAILVTFPGNIILVALFISIFLVIYSLQSKRNSQKLEETKNKLDNAEAELIARQQSSLESRKMYWETELIRVSNQAVSELIDNEELYNSVIQRRQEAQDILSQIEQENYVDWPRLQSAITFIHQAIIIEKSQKQSQRQWQMAVIVATVIYIVIVFLPLIFGRNWQLLELIPVYSVPWAIVMWGAAGSLAHILHRFYNQRGRVRFDVELRWVLARPMIGILMSGVSYMAISSGLVVLGSQPPDATEATLAEFGIYAVIGFLAGFSDRFFERIIALLTSAVNLSDSQQQQGQKD